MKKYILGVVFLLIFFFCIYSVRAYDVNVDGSGQAGMSSLVCNTGNCINSLNFEIKVDSTTYKFNNTAIYGMRLTVLNKKGGNTIKGPINYWAISSMQSINDKNIFYKNNKYTDKVDPTGTLWNKVNLRTIDSSNGTYALYAESLTSDDLTKILNNMNVSVDDCINKNYVLKIEPIFVIRHIYGDSVTYYSGTPKEIVNMLYTNFANKNFECDAAVMVLNSNGFHVVTNYLTTIYDDSNGAPDLNVDKYVTSNSCYSGYHRAIYGGGNPDGRLGIGYINLKDRIKNKSKTIQVCKRIYTDDDEDGGWYPYKAKFQLIRKLGNSEYENVGDIQETDPENKKFCVSFTVSDFTKPYSVREIIDGPIKVKQTFFYNKLVDDGEGEYNGYLGYYYFSYDSSGTRYATSAPFYPYDTNLDKYYIMVWNELWYNSMANVKVYKYLGNGDGNNNSFNYQTEFRLYRTDKMGDNISDCSGAKATSIFITATKKFDQDEAYFKNLNPGCYILAELDMNFHKNVHKINKIHFYTKEGIVKNKLGDSIDIGNDDEIRSAPFYVKNNSVKEIIVYNDDGNSNNDSCSSKLNKIKNDYASDKDSVKALSELENLFLEMRNKGRYYNLLFNYDPNMALGKSDNLLNNVVCGKVLCEYKYSSDVISDSSVPSVKKFSCNKGYFEYGVNTKIDSSSKKISASKSIIFDASVSDDEKSNIQSEINNENFKFYQTTCDYGIRFDYYNGATCGVSYEYDNNTFKNVKVNSGQLLWGKSISNNVIGNIRMKFRCYYLGSNLQYRLHGINFDEIIDDYLPYGNVNLGNLLVSDSFHIDSSYSSSKYASKYVSIDHNNYFLYVTEEVTLPIRYDTLRYLSPYTGIFSNKELSGYYPAGYGLPIAVDTKKGNYSANLSLNLLFPAKEFNTTCDFSVENVIVPPPDDPGGPGGPGNKNFNFNFRIIDTTNPFPGINGEGRTTGDNWCSDSRIGKKVKDEDGKEFLVGDINGDGFINEEDFEVSDFKMKPSLVADIDGDGEVTDATNIDHCNDEMTDRCILKRYVLNTFQNPYRNYNCSFDSNKNYIVKNYITGDADYKVENSYSNNQPMYSFTLTPSDIKDIRSYNKKISYINENGLKLDEDGNYLSDFITENLNKLLNTTTSRCYELRRNDKWCSNN